MQQHARANPQALFAAAICSVAHDCFANLTAREINIPSFSTLA
jgi:hypothetical protein